MKYISRHRKIDWILWVHQAVWQLTAECCWALRLLLLGKRKITITDHLKCITSFCILLNRASIIIAIDTIRKCSAFTSIWPYLSDEISTENLQTKVQTYQPYNINCDQLQIRPDQINSRPGGLVNCVTFWSMNQQMNQSICSNRVKLMSTLATCNCFVWLWRGNQSMQSFTLNQANHY